MTYDSYSKRLIDHALLGLCRLIPKRVARHILFLLRSFPSLADEWGYHIRPIHYYEPLPDYRAIAATDLVNRRESPAIEFDVAGQVSLIRRLSATYRGELDELAARGGSAGFDFSNPYFAGLDAAVYYALIRDLKPARVIEIGCGFSTRIADRALRRNRVDGSESQLICVEPYPEARLTEANLQMTLVQKCVQDVALEQFDVLRSGDVLFIDSSHAVKFGGDVCCEFLEILPRLRPGVWVHVHDIFFPYDYPAEWLINRRVGYTEQYLLEAFLAFNRTFSVRVVNHWLCCDYPSVVEGLCPGGQSPTEHGLGSSFWMRKEA